MPKKTAKTAYVCGACGAESPRWLGRCSDCGEWNSFEEKLPEASPGRHVRLVTEGSEPQEVSAIDSSLAPRVSLGLQEIDRVLGGGIVPGSITLIGGDPGIGKSTLLLQIAHKMAKGRGRVLYVSGEESPQQIKLRAERLGVSGEGLLLLAETDLQRVLGTSTRSSRSWP
jgi:DNA repair protein RadA/Sms